MPAAKLKQYLDSQKVKYISIQHSPAYTAQEVAASTHVSGRDFAKTVIVNLEGALAMVVLPADRKVVLSDLREPLGKEKVMLATEEEFRECFEKPPPSRVTTLLELVEQARKLTEQKREPDS